MPRKLRLRVSRFCILVIGFACGFLATYNEQPGHSGVEALRLRLPSSPILSSTSPHSESEFFEIDFPLINSATFETLNKLLEQSTGEEGIFYLSRLSDLDPHRVLHMLLEPSFSRFRHVGFSILFHKWVSKDPREALDAVLQVESISDRMEMEFRLFNAFATEFPEEAFAILQDQNDSKLFIQDRWNTLNPYYITFFNWANTDMNSALLAYSEVEGEFDITAASDALARGLCQSGRSYQEAFQKSSEFAEDKLRSRTQFTILGDAFRNEPAEALAIIKGINDISLARHLLKANVGNWIYAEPKEFLNLLQQVFDAEDYKTSLVRYVDLLSKNRPLIAVDIFQNDLPSNVRDSSRVQMIFANALSRLEVNSGFDWLVENRRDAQALIPTKMVHSYSYQIPERLADFVIEAYPKEELRPTLEMVMNAWQSYDRDGMLKWMENAATHGRAEVREFLDYREMKTNVMIRPTDYASQLAEGTYSEHNAEFVKIVAESFDLFDPLEAIEWISTFKDTRLSTVAVNAYSKKWLQYDSLTASEWIETLPQGEHRQVAVRNLVDEMRDLDPIAAAEWERELE